MLCQQLSQGDAQGESGIKWLLAEISLQDSVIGSYVSTYLPILQKILCFILVINLDVKDEFLLFYECINAIGRMVKVNVFFQGMGVGAGLIIAIGAQNVFVLTQGIQKQHHWLTALICSISDVLLIFIGAAGVGGFVAGNHALQTGAAWLGAGFLGWYGLRALVSVTAERSLQLRKGDDSNMRIIVLTALALTFLNPHVYIDTVLLLGSIGGQYQAGDRYLFALGASLSSVLWFFSLSFGGALLAPIFQKSISWKILNVLVCTTMWVIAMQLIMLKI